MDTDLSVIEDVGVVGDRKCVEGDVEEASGKDHQPHRLRRRCGGEQVAHDLGEQFGGVAGAAGESVAIAGREFEVVRWDLDAVGLPPVRLTPDL
ncbi:hypothetical protein [Nocardia fluminea]|uniref:hypothetical protein n=1 Tax=Nocardia fluminea TaxID=134984 RepID=UPI0034254C16